MKSMVDLPWVDAVRSRVAKVAVTRSLLLEIGKEVWFRFSAMMKHPHLRRSFFEGLGFTLGLFFFFPFQQPEIVLLLLVTPMAAWYVYVFRAEQSRVLTTLGLIAGSWLSACWIAPFVPAVQRFIGGLGNRVNGGGAFVATGIAISLVFGILAPPVFLHTRQIFRAKRPQIEAWQTQKTQELTNLYAVWKTRADQQIAKMEHYSSATIAPHEFYGFTKNLTDMSRRTKKPDVRRRLQREKWLQWQRATDHHIECYLLALVGRGMPRKSAESLVLDLQAQSKQRLAELGMYDARR